MAAVLPLDFIMPSPSTSSSFRSPKFHNPRCTLPPDPFRIKVDGTDTTLTFHNWKSRLTLVGETDFLDMTYIALDSTFNAVVAARGDGPIGQISLEWASTSGDAFLAVNNEYRQMTWLMLAATIQGIRTFGKTVGYYAIPYIIIYDDLQGPVGSARLGLELGGAQNVTAERITQQKTGTNLTATA
ncbi:hypothetical protein ACLMJK_007052 [Lecanora helva]